MRFIESILLRDGVYHNLDLHQARVDQVFSQYASEFIPHQLKRILPDLKMEGAYKVRMVYDMDSEDATYDLEYAAYYPRKIESLEVVHSKPFDYSHKFENRTTIEELARNSEADDVIIAINNNITDGSYFNLAFFDGDQWVTPDTPLLNGVRRQQLLKEGVLREQPIQTKDLAFYKKVSLINAMLDLGVLELPVSAISLPRSDA